MFECQVKYFAVVINRWELQSGELIEWHREKAGTIEAVHDVLKNELSAGVMPSKYFGANAAWLRLPPQQRRPVAGDPGWLRWWTASLYGRRPCDCCRWRHERRVPERTLRMFF